MAWDAYPVPDSSPPTDLKRLPSVIPGRAFTVVVRFPPGWTRPSAGYFVSAEEVFVLEGRLHMSGRHYGPGDYGWFAAGYHRYESTAPDGVLALAWFGGPARWTRSAGPAPDFDPEGVVITRSDEREAVASPFGSSEAQLLRSGPVYSSYILDGIDAAAAPPDRVVEIFTLADHAWQSIEPGGAIPKIAGTVFCRLTAFETPG